MNVTVLSKGLRGWLPDLPLARCASPDYDPDMWHSNRRKSTDTKQAMAVCQTCPVMQECLEWAVEHRPLVMGVWGGMHFRPYSRRTG